MTSMIPLQRTKKFTERNKRKKLAVSDKTDWQKIDYKGQYDMVVIGCSAGGIEALGLILQALPKVFKPTIAIVQHISPDSTRSLADHFSVMTHIPVREVEDKEPIMGGTAYFAPPNYHLLLAKNGVFNLSTDELVNFSRPAIDVLFESAAEIYQDRVIGIILTGTNQDGAEGLKKIKQNGGLAIIQDPETAKYPMMPQKAKQLAEPQLVLDLNDIGIFLNKL